MKSEAAFGDYQGLVWSIWYLVRLVAWMGWFWVKSLIPGCCRGGWGRCVG